MLKLTSVRSGLPIWVNVDHVVSVSQQTLLDLSGPVPGAPIWTEVAVTNGNPVQVTEDAEPLARQIAAMLKG